MILVLLCTYSCSQVVRSTLESVRIYDCFYLCLLQVSDGHSVKQQAESPQGNATDTIVKKDSFSDCDLGAERHGTSNCLFIKPVSLPYRHISQDTASATQNQKLQIRFTIPCRISATLLDQKGVCDSRTMSHGRLWSRSGRCDRDRGLPCYYDPNMIFPAKVSAGISL